MALIDPISQNQFINYRDSEPVGYQNVSTTIKLKGKDMKVHEICAGTVAVKTAFRSKKGNGALVKLNILLDAHYIG